jgi:hypothetical protein
MSDGMKKGVAGVLVVAAVLIGIAVYNHTSSSAGCTLTASAAGVLAAHVAEGDDAGKVLAAAFAALVPAGCTEAVDDLVDSPSTPVSLNTAQGTTTVTGQQFLNDLDRSCSNYSDAVGQALCNNGVLPPVAAK